MLYYQITCKPMTIKEGFDDTSPRERRNFAMSLIPRCTCFNRSSDTGAFIFIVEINESQITLGAICRDRLEEKEIKEFLRITNLLSEKIAFEEVLFSDLENLLRISDRNCHIDSCSDILEAFGLDDLTGNSFQRMTFGENLLDLKKYSKAEDIKTAIIPVGKDNVTITTANGHNGTDYVYSQDAVDLYGWIYDKVDFSEVYDPDKLLEEANKYLQKCINLAITIELTAVDLHMIDVDINAIRLGDLVPCISTQHGIMSTFGNPDTYYLVSKYELDLENPANNKITLGRTISTLTDKQVQSSQNLETKINEVRTEMYNISGNDMEPITNETLEGLLN